MIQLNTNISSTCNRKLPTNCSLCLISDLSRLPTGQICPQWRSQPVLLAFGYERSWSNLANKGHKWDGLEKRRGDCSVPHCSAPCPHQECAAPTSLDPAEGTGEGSFLALLEVGFSCDDASFLGWYSGGASQELISGISSFTGGWPSIGGTPKSAPNKTPNEAMTRWSCMYFLK